MNIMAIKTGEIVEHDSLVLERRMRGNLLFVAARTGFALHCRVSERGFRRVRFVTIYAGHFIGIVLAADPLHSLEFTHVIGMTTDAGRRLFGHDTFVVESQQCRKTGATGRA